MSCSLAMVNGMMTWLWYVHGARILSTGGGGGKLEWNDDMALVCWCICTCNYCDTWSYMYKVDVAKIYSC